LGSGGREHCGPPLKWREKRRLALGYYVHRLTTDKLDNLTRPNARGLGPRNKSVSMSWRVWWKVVNGVHGLA
jgi:hypothetical protein